MQRRSYIPAILWIASALAAIFLTATLVLAADKPIEKFTCFAASLGTGKAGTIEIGITRWSTDEERQKLLTTLQEFGSDKLADELSKIRPPVGYIRTPTRVGYDLFYARNHPNPDGSRRIVMATNRLLSFREVANADRSSQYQVTVIEMHLGADGKGEGKIVPAAKIHWDNATKTIEIENYNALPVELLNVAADKS